MKIIINHGGTFTTPSMIRYKGGKVDWVDDIDSYIFSIVEVTSMMKELGYENPCMAYYYKKPNKDLDNGLTELAVDKDVCEMLIEPNEPDIGSGSDAEVNVGEDEWLKDALNKLHRLSKKCEQPSRNEVGQSSRNGSCSDNGSGSSSSGSDSEDNDFFVDEENMIDDVDVDMADFKSHTYPDVEWVGCKESVVEENEVFELEEVDHEDFDSASDSDEGVGRKALRKVARCIRQKLLMVKQFGKKTSLLDNNLPLANLGQVPDFANNNMGSVVPITCDPKAPTSKVQPKSMLKKKTKPIEYYGCPWAMQVSKLPNEDTWEVKTLEDNHKCLQSRIVKKCTTTFLSKEVEESIKPNPKIPLSAL
ncbi:hypothetical protein Tco_0731925 [Tanacetum coccineum]